MFGKKKVQVSPRGAYKCLVAGCGLVCMDEASLKRHADWAHPTAKSTDGKPQDAGQEIRRA